MTLAKLHAQGIAAEPPKLLGGPGFYDPFHAYPPGLFGGSNYQQPSIGILPGPRH